MIMCHLHPLLSVVSKHMKSCEIHLGTINYCTNFAVQRYTTIKVNECISFAFNFTCVKYTQFEPLFLYHIKVVRIVGKSTFTDIYRQKGYHPPVKLPCYRNRAPIGVFRFLQTTHKETNTYKRRSIHAVSLQTACPAVLHVCLCQSAAHTCTHLTNQASFDHREKPEYPQLKPH